MTDNRLNAERGQPMLRLQLQPGQRDSSDVLLPMALQLQLAQRDAPPAVGLGRRQPLRSQSCELGGSLL